ncbi:hypothetical protein D0859_08166 [Hortaea werneckii]|nr:hypothetical protein D0859_08166 [Hortaea werneckii]
MSTNRTKSYPHTFNKGFRWLYAYRLGLASRTSCKSDPTADWEKSVTHQVASQLFSSLDGVNGLLQERAASGEETAGKRESELQKSRFLRGR